jgi:hypothetical protein
VLVPAAASSGGDPQKERLNRLAEVLALVRDVGCRLMNLGGGLVSFPYRQF